MLGVEVTERCRSSFPLKSLESLFSCEGVQPRPCCTGIGCLPPDVISLVTSSLMIFADSDWFTLKVYVGSFTLVHPPPSPLLPLYPRRCSTLCCHYVSAVRRGGFSRLGYIGRNEFRGHWLSRRFGMERRFLWACSEEVIQDPGTDLRMVCNVAV